MKSDCFMDVRINAFWSMLYELERDTRSLFHAVVGYEDLFCQGSIGTD